MAIAPVPPLSDVPDFPALSDRAAGTYNSKAYAFGTHMANTFNAEIAAVANNVHGNATEAATSAVTANTKAGEALISAAAAALDADRLATLDALWLGAQASDPATGRDGEPLVAGNAYVNTATGYLRAYNGAAWMQSLSANAGVLSLNGQDGALTLKTIGGQAITGAGDIPLTTAAAVAVAALDIDCSAGVYFTKTIAGNTTFTFSNPPASGAAYAFVLELTHTSGTVSWPAAVRWPDNLAPTLTASRTHLFVFTTDDAGARWRAAVNPNYTP